MMAPHSSRIDRAAIVRAARGWIGTPYVHQASCKGAGCDCLGLIRGVWRELIGAEPEKPPAYTPWWAEDEGEETMLAAARRHLRPLARRQLRPGDVVLFRYRRGLPAKHAAIATGACAMIHAQEGAGVVEAPLSPWWNRRIAGVFAFPGIEEND